MYLIVRACQVISRFSVPFRVSSRSLIFRQSVASFSWPGRSPGTGSNPAPGAARADSQFTSTEVVYGVTGTGVTELPEYGVSP